MKRNVKYVRGRQRTKQANKIRYLSSDAVRPHFNMGNSAKIISIEHQWASKVFNSRFRYADKTFSRSQRVKDKKYNLEVECKNVGLLI